MHRNQYVACGTPNIPLDNMPLDKEPNMPLDKEPKLPLD